MIFKLAIFAIVCYVLYRLFMNDRKKQDEKKAAERERKIQSDEMVKDPVCGTYVDKSSAISVRSGDQVLYFCSYECRQKYIESVQEQKKLD
ncbi:MAG: transcriptional regulator [Desulfovibrio sp.]|jgi:YHS domain-containing protein|nr:transcriptional regulator [Mailhella sp.]MBQ3892703.1 transcriptional regulator [Mailhella sp.]